MDVVGRGGASCELEDIMLKDELMEWYILWLLLVGVESVEGFPMVGAAGRWLDVFWEGGDLGELNDFLLNAELIDW